MGTRVITGLVLLGLCAGVLLLSRIPLVLTAAVATVSGMAMAELGNAMGKKPWIWGVFGAAAGIGVCMLNRFLVMVLLCGLFPVYLLTSWSIMAGLPEKKQFLRWEQVVIALSVPLFFGGAYHLRQQAWGALTLALFVCAATDTFAYFVGRRFGKHPLVPKVSPKKTLEGAKGGSLLATVLVALLGAVLHGLGIVRLRLGLLVLYTATATVVGQFGDLCMSAVKRVAGIKDFGQILPGHGGVLDRADSAMAVIPYTFLFVNCFGGFVR